MPTIDEIIERERMKMKSTTELLDSFGLEFEAEQVVRGNLPRNLKNFFSEDHDASIETPAIRYNPERENQFFEDPEEMLNFPTTTIGSEFVSKILNVNSIEARKAIDSLVSYLYCAGECEESFRSGIHVHINLGYRLPTLINLVKLSAYLEQVFYYVGGMGYEHRGLRNDFIYCRPITKFGPTITKWNSKNIQIFNTNRLTSSNSVEEFFDNYGGINVNNPPGKYYPVRYNWMTLYPLLTKGTIEFRVFNKTLNPSYIWNAILFSRKVCETALFSKKILDLPENSIYDPHDKHHVLESFYNFARMSEMEDSPVYSLETIINRTPDMIANPEYCYSHLEGKFNPNFQNVDPEVITARIKNPNFVDLHTLNRRLGRE